jgi:predicted RNase H-like nuclease
VPIQRFLGVDLAWAQRTDGRLDNETGLVALDAAGHVVDAGWSRGVPATLDWIEAVSDPAGTLLFVDASLIVENESGQRLCETQVGQRYGHLKVSANTTNLASPRQAGAALWTALQAGGWTYGSGWSGPPDRGRQVSECYPYVTLVGTEEFGYYRTERPKYKRKPPRLPVAQWRPERAANCDELVRRLATLAEADPPLHLAGNAVTARLLTEPAPLNDRDYKHREDLIDAAIAAWTALLWSRHGFDRCQILGPPDVNGKPGGTIIAPALPCQRRD